jgi:hypothetical protein
MVHQWPGRLPVQLDLLSLLTRWGTVQGIDQPLSLQYSKDWLQPDFSDVFLSAYDCCRRATKKDRFQLAFTLASVSYSLLDDHALVPTLLAFATIPELRGLDSPPDFTSYDLSDGFMPSDTKLNNIINACTTGYAVSEERNLPAVFGEDERTLGKRRYAAFKDKCDSEKPVILSKVRDAWPCEHPPALTTLQVNYYDLDVLSGKLSPIFRSCWRNHRLKLHLDVMHRTLKEFHDPNSNWPSQYNLDSRPELLGVTSPSSPIDAQYLFDRHAPVIFMHKSPHVLPSANQRDMVYPDTRVTARLKELITDFRARGSDKFRRKYADDLDQSKSIYCDEKIVTTPDSTPYTMELLLEYHSLHSRQFRDSLASISHALSPASAAETALYDAGLWPRITPNFLFTRMASAAVDSLGSAWRATLVHLSQILLQLQRSRRLLVFAAKEYWVEFFKELESEEYEGFDPELYPDWLLIQVRYKEIDR